MSYTFRDINESAVYVLKKDKLESFYTEYIQIEKDLLDEIDVESFYQTLDDKTYGNADAKDRIEKQQQSIKEFYARLSLNFNYLYTNRNYCLYLSSEYGAFFNITTNNQITLYQNQNPYNLPILVELPRHSNGSARVYGAKNFKSYTVTFLQSYLLQKTYEKYISELEIKVVSHRFNGWKNFSYVLNDTLSVEIATNFGFGSASYFTVTLIFRGVKIIPYSRLVLYRNADFLQILRNTREYAIENGSWELALDFIRDASNDFQTEGNDGFIKKYVIEECEILVDALERTLNQNAIRQSDNLSGFFISVKSEVITEVELEGFLLIVVRGEKISGATEFVENISNWSDILPTKEFINRITSCCLKVLPQLSKGIVDVENFLNAEQKRHDELCDKRDEMNKAVNELLHKTNLYQGELQSIRIEIRNNYVETNQIHTINNDDLTELVFKEINERYPELNGIEKKFDTVRDEFYKTREDCTDLSKTLSAHQDYLSSMNRSKQSIEKYLEIEA